MRKLLFETNNFYHIYNRGNEKHNIFFDKSDYQRFISNIYYFNDKNFRPENFDYHQGLALMDNRQTLVNILAWCLMPNHFHLVLCQKEDCGIAKFMQRLGTGYTMYTNLKYKRSGHVFQGPFKAKAIKKDEHLTHITRYVHLNPLELVDPGWKEQGVRNIGTGKKFILEYPWSSLPNYLGKNNHNEIVNLEEFWKLFDGDFNGYEIFLWEWLAKGIPLPFADFTTSIKA